MTGNSEIIISRQALLHNLRQFRKIAPKSKTISVVKSNAYGHGAYPVASATEEMTDWFATANLNEALWLRGMGISKPILVLSYYDLEQVEEAVKKNISLVVYDAKQAKAMNVAAYKLRKKAKAHIKIDTGTSRLGVTSENVKELVDYVKTLRQVEIEGVFSHLAASEEDIEFTLEQLKAFNHALLDLGLANSPIRHIACSAASLVLKDSHFDAIRLGIGLYGLWPSNDAKKEALKIFSDMELRPVMTWKTKIIQVKNLKTGSFVGYGKSYQIKRPTVLAVLPIGYFEGYDRKLGNNAEVLVAGKRCKVLGRVCMNLIMVDVTEIKKVKVGDEATLLGKDGKEEITADELAKIIGTINYEVVARINPNIPRILK